MKKKATKRQKCHKFKEEKLTGISPIETVESMVYKNKSITDHDAPKLHDVLDRDQCSVKSKPKYHRKSRKIICPNCKEKVEIISTTEEEENLKCDSSTYGSKEISPTTAYACRAPLSKNHKGKIENDGDICFHEPRCEMVPVCQILPCDDNYLNSKSNKSQTSPKQNTRVIRITKACRHHPPCTVVPSCQRANVLKNNCEYIPPCLHRPRCVNLPLCVPFSKSMHYEEVNKHVDENENSECPHVPRCKYIPLCQHDSLVNNVNHQIHMIPQMQHACEFMNGYQTPAFLITPQTNCMPNSYSPCQVSSPNTCSYKPSKSCQYDCTDNKCYTFNVPKASNSNEMVVFIRDVGCQFRNKNYSPKESVMQSKVSSESIDFVDVKIDKYYTDVHTLRYEDKFTNPISGGEVSLSSGSLSTSIENNTNSPSHEQRATRNSPRSRQTGFSPEAAYVTAFNIYGEPTATAAHISPNSLKELSKCDARMCRDCLNPSNVKSRKSLLNHKYKKMFNRRKKCRSSRHVNLNRSKQIIYLKTIEKNNYV
ncbi:hypothetical protein O3G_MSEX003505 [Manduca sexta]|uniref:Uncharacterized protein n=2 Tax=Manduca sexta TaxID=7130 RepID=A0A921YRX5_MANSE|nr:hypothetical protein O3G_MSEX003505 [Manduca sexta]